MRCPAGGPRERNTIRKNQRRKRERGRVRVRVRLGNDCEIRAPLGTSDADFLRSIAQTRTNSRLKKNALCDRPRPLLAPSRSPIVLELVLVLGFFSQGEAPP